MAATWNLFFDPTKMFQSGFSVMFDLKTLRANQSKFENHPAGGHQFPRPMAEKAMVPDDRRRISIRFRIASGFLICFFMALSITLVSLYVLIRLQTKVQFLEVADNLMLELQQARRFEKNFFLYGTNLDDALDHVNTALKFLQVNALQLKEVVGKKNLANILEQIRTYENLLQRLQDSVSSGIQGAPERTGAHLFFTLSFWGDGIFSPQALPADIGPLVPANEVYPTDRPGRIYPTETHPALPG
jgi:hypothetical protein